MGGLAARTVQGRWCVGPLALAGTGLGLGQGGLADWRTRPRHAEGPQALAARLDVSVILSDHASVDVSKFAVSGTTLGCALGI